MNNWTSRTEILSQIPFLSTVTRTKAQLDAIRPLPEAVEGRVMQKIRLDWNFHSNAIEGNKLTRGETYTFLMEGLTAKAKPFKDHQDIKGHNKAIDFLFDLVKDQRDLTEGDIRDLHKIILVEPYKNPAITLDGQSVTKTIKIGEYKTLPNYPKTPTGEIHYYATPEETPILMAELVQWYNLVRENVKIHPVVLAAVVHHRFVEIHPFDDGNGRVARMLMNLILIKNKFPSAIIKQDKREEYYAALAQADKNEYEAIVEFVAESVLDSMNLYLKAAKGENIEEDADLDKEIALFKMGLGKSARLNDLETNQNIIRNLFLPIYDKAFIQLGRFDELFDERSNNVIKLDGVSKPAFERQHIEFTLKRRENVINRLAASISWSGFKQFTISFYLNTSLSIHFGDAEYQLLVNDNLIATRSYDEVINDFEIDKIVNQWVRLTFEDLKKKVAEANK